MSALCVLLTYFKIRVPAGVRSYLHKIPTLPRARRRYSRYTLLRNTGGWRKQDCKFALFLHFVSPPLRSLDSGACAVSGDNFTRLDARHAARTGAIPGDSASHGERP
eukprot:7134274-Prymnesium_polylepis.2